MTTTAEMTDIVRLALSYSDGSYNVLEKDDIEYARRNRESSDDKETDPEHLTNIVRVRIEEIEIVEQYRGKPAPAQSKSKCAHCGQDAP